MIQEYNSEPVLYCSRCYSLKILSIEGLPDSDYCGDCGSSDIAETSIEEWESLYESRYGSKFVEHKKDLRNHPLFHAPLWRVTRELLSRDNYYDIIRMFYPGFRKSYCKTDTVMLFIDRMLKDGMLDELKLHLIKTLK